MIVHQYLIANGLTSPYEQLQQLSDSLKAKFIHSGIEIDCDPISVKEVFEQLSQSHQLAYLKRFNTYYHAVASALEEYDRRSELVFLWSILKELGVRPPSRLFELLSENHFIEIYDPNGIQIFRNMEACRLLSYTLHQLLLEPWDNLFERTAESKNEVRSAFELVFRDGQINLNLGIAPHFAKERKSARRKLFRVEMKYFAPLFDSNGRVLYMIAGSQVEPVS